MFVTNWISTTKIQKISEITNFFRHYFLSRTEVCVKYSPLFVNITSAEIVVFFAEVLCFAISLILLQKSKHRTI